MQAGEEGLEERLERVDSEDRNSGASNLLDVPVVILEEIISFTIARIFETESN